MKFTKTHLGVVFVFIAGIALGSVSTNFVKHLIFGAPRGPAATKELLLDKMAYELSLSQEQREKIKPIVFDLYTKFDVFHKDASPKLREMIHDATGKMEPHLNDAQKVELKEISQRFLKRHQADMPPQESAAQ